MTEPSNRKLGSPLVRRLGPREMLGLAAWFGLVAGFREVLTKVICTHVGRSSRLYQMSRHFVWLIPLTNLLIFLGLGIFLAVMVRIWPRFGRWLGTRWLGALAAVPALSVAVPEIYAAAWFMLAFGCAAWCAPFVERRAAGFRRIVGFSFPVLVAAVPSLAGLVVGQEWAGQVRESSRPHPATSAPNVLLIVLDTVRADRLSAYGYARPTTPTLGLMAANGVRFTAARSTSPWTLASHASMFTGRLPHELRAEWLAPLGARFPTLAGYLGSRGYATAGFVANTLYCGHETGLGDGFTHYEDYELEQMDALLMAKLADRALFGFFQLSCLVRTHFRSNALAPVEFFVNEYIFSGKRKDAATINRGFFGWLDRRSQPDRPFFAFLNYMDTHASYFPPTPADYRFGLRPTNPVDVAVLQNWEWIDKASLDGYHKALASDCYDDCLRALDGQISLLFAGLAAKGLLDRTLIIVTADHGESFGEHGLYLHGDSLYRSEIQVPLLIRPPVAEPARAVVDDAVSLRDLPATVVDLLGLEQGSPFTGRSMAQTWDSTRRAAPVPVVSELAAPNPADPNRGRSPARRGPLVALAFEKYVYINSGTHEELFDASWDPDERRNLARDQAVRPVLERLRAELGRVVGPGTRR